jgi:hypothetical protein
MGFLKIMLVKEMETGNDDENDGEVSDYHDDDPDWSCELDRYESSGSESDDGNDEAEKRSQNHIRFVTIIMCQPTLNLSF